MHHIVHEIIHEVYHCLTMVPFLFMAYLLIEYIEKYSSDKMEKLMTGFGRMGPLGGAVLGCIPQCGFSAAAANLYSTRLITMGTLVAVFLSTSDEAIPLLLSNPGHGKTILKIIAIKIAIGAIVGFAADFIFKSTPDMAKEELHHKHAHCGNGKKTVSGMLIAALKHTAETFLFIAVISIAFNFAVQVLSEERLAALFMANTIFQPFVTALVGFVPNCATSVLLTKLYIEGAISFGSAVAGLCSAAGVGLMVLFKENRPAKDNFRIIAVVYVSAVIAGLVF